MVQDLFGSINEPAPAKKELIIKKTGKQTLGKKQNEFNRLVKKLEKTRTKLGITKVRLDEGLKYYIDHIHPLEQQLVAVRVTGVKIFFSFYSKKGLLQKNDKKILGGIISSALDEIISLSDKEPDNELKAIFEAVNGQSFEELKKESFEEMKSEMEEMLEDMGFEVDLGSINEHMSEEEVAQKMKEMHEDFARQADEINQKKTNGKKTKKQIAQEERQKQVEAARNKNIGTIYKQLAKVFHPDLEKDDALKQQKEELMKQLTVAYESNDLHTLLKLEMEWLQKEEHKTDQLSDEKLGIYNEVLQEQIWDIEIEIEESAEHPRYMRLRRYIDGPEEVNLKELAKEAQHLKKTVVNLADDETYLKGKDGLDHVKWIINEYKNEPVDFSSELDKLLKEFMNGKR